MVSPNTIRKLTKELVTLQQTPPDGVRVLIDEADVLNFSGWIQGPPGTPYSDGFFQISFDFEGVDFPNVPPTCKFRTKIFHPNVSRAGDICVSTLKKDWKPEYGIARILVTIKCLLIAPNPDSALDPEASRLLQEDYEEYAQTANMWTSIHASKRPAAFNALTAASEQVSVQTSAPLQASCSQNALSLAATEPIPSAAIKAPLALKKPVTTAPKRGLRRL